MAYIEILVGHIDVSPTVDDDRPERLLDPAATLFNRGRLWSLDDVPPTESAYCDPDENHHCRRARDLWVAAHAQRYAEYRALLLGACDRGLTRLRSIPSESPSCSGDYLDMCIGGNAALLSLATVTALRDWHRVISPAAPHTSSPYALSLCNLFDPACAARLLVRCDTKILDDDGAIECATRSTAAATAATAIEEDLAHLDGRRQTKRCRGGDPCMPVAVDSRAAFEDALRMTFPHAADIVLRLVGAAGADDSDDDPILSGVILAGGCVVEAVQQEHLRAHSLDSDMDLWIVGQDSQERKKAFRRVVETLFRELPNHAATVGGSVVTFALRDTVVATNREKVQVIYTDGRCGGDVISAFDLAHTAAYYDGKTVWALWDCAWALVARSTDAIGAGGIVRQARLERAALKGFQPTDALIEAVALTNDDNKGDHDDTDDDAAIGSDLKAPYAAVADEYVDVDAVLAAFTYRPIDARDYDKHLALPSDCIVAMDDPVYLTMPPLYMPFRAMCHPCIASGLSRNRRSDPCTCNLAVHMCLDLPRFVGDGGDLSNFDCLTEPAVAFRRRIDDLECALSNDLKASRFNRTDSRTDGRLRERMWKMMWESVVKNKGPEPHQYPGLLRLQCLATAPATDALTGQTMNLKGIEGVWVDGRVTFLCVSRMGPTIVRPTLTAAELRVYPRSLQIIVHGLDNARSC
jgi:hypothetical protein